MLAAMLNSKPTGADKKAIERWEATNRMTIEIFLAFWQKVSPDLTVEAGDEASYIEWEDVNGKNYGTRKPGDAKHGIIRTINRYGIREATYCENKPHGLWFYWSNNPTIAFVAVIYNHGEQKAWIQWRDDW